MKQTKLVPITSLDQLEVGSVIVDKEGDRRKILAKCGLVVGTSCLNHFSETFQSFFTIEELEYNLYQLEVTEEPWRPKPNELYFFPHIAEGKADSDQDSWDEKSNYSQSHLKNNMICKTEEEALAKAQKMLDSIKDSE
jgi:hypothetical protein